jgi:hypothetical protein
MEGNACYKFSTIRNFVEISGAAPISTAIDVGVNIGDVTLLLKKYFPFCRVFGFEPVREYFEIAKERLIALRDVELFPRPVTAQHLFEDDLGQIPRADRTLALLKARPEAGPGWRGGSKIVCSEEVTMANSKGHYNREDQHLQPLTLDEMVESVLEQTGASDVDLVKMDCEGCESSCLGCCESHTLERIRFIVGEYHDFARFYRVVERKLFVSHKVSLIGDAELGAFFAERREGNRDGVLKCNNSGMRQSRPWLAPFPTEWHVFNKHYVVYAERSAHAIK